ncbi:apolipoprotein N-acyltransferase [Nocardia sp. SYP-A9097]|uniref:apolipoprotein N-acyltransferase n=1 Tax=Nocardia sp. SYP-A9097 TaxID=2663237 RepID=UPI0013271AFB|nr:apolipoprotein N-acyltransferase [Nocardia sp. SYP-A9097]MRH90133.1 apolipoprotein N-acyltransferase [Nocardia sp. SYP-A9097]
MARAVGLLRAHPVLTRIVAAVVAGLLLFASFPPRTLWFLAPVGIALLILTVRGNGRLRGGFGYGFLAGLAFFLPLLPWTGIYVGPMPWIALSTALSVYVGLFGMLVRLVGRMPGWPLWVATAWSLTEWARSSFPFGGFPWGRLAFGQADGWYLPYAMLGGAPLVSFAVALTGAGLAAAAVWGVACARSTAGANARPNRPRWADRRLTSWNRIVAVAMLVAIVPLTGVILRTALPRPEDGNRPITVAAIQGSVPRLGLDFNAQRRAVLDNHVKRTEELARAVAAGRAPQPDVVVWPENSSDIDPLRNSDAYAEITRASRDIKAPILVGAVLVNDDRTTSNSVIVWTADGGPGERHDKKIIQPFGEYLPYRGFFRHFSEYADRAGYFVPGNGDGVVHVEPASGGAPVAIGVATCYEVAFDRAFEDAVRAGAQILTVPSNNATFGKSEMTYQQLAMSRIRAVEHGRAVIVSVTTGVSAMITADGTIQQQTEQFVPADLVARLPLRTDLTPASRIGPAPERILCIVAAAVVLAAMIRRRATNANPVESDEVAGTPPAE